jgi:hypothetical protein
MQLRKAQVTNFKIVEDSTEFKLDRVTCLVGKNESGKTALLDALYRLNPYDDADSGYDKVEEYPRRYLTDYDERHEGEAARVVATHWELEDSDVNAVESLLGKGCLKSREILVHKKYEDPKQFWTVPLDEPAVVNHLIEEAGLHTEEAQPAREHKTVASLKRYLDKKAAAASDREKKVSAAIATFRDADPHKAAMDVLHMPKFLLFADYDAEQAVRAVMPSRVCSRLVEVARWRPVPRGSFLYSWRDREPGRLPGLPARAGDSGCWARPLRC